MTTDHALTLTRRFTARPEQVWTMWTDPDRFASWYGPAGASIRIAEFDVRIGGRRRVCMEVGATRMWFAGDFREIVPFETLVYSEIVADEHGEPAADAVPPGHPVSTVVRVQLVADPGGTTMTVTHVGIPPDSPAANGWNMALDALAERLTRA